MSQDVSAAWTAEEKDSVRNIAGGLLLSWKKESALGATTFTIGVSTIGGSDLIGINPGAVGSPGNYKYFDESDYVTSLSWERGFNLPIGGLSQGMAEAVLSNTSGRFLPDYMGGVSELSTAILPRRPFIINAGFEIDGVEQTIPQFSGVLKRQPVVDIRNKTVQLQGTDYVDFFAGRSLDHTAMFTGQRSDVVIEGILRDNLGLSTSQYVLEEGLNVLSFGIFNSGDKFSDIINEIAKAENANFYQDEQGIFRFENRQHWNRAPHNEVNRIVLTGQVIDALTPNEDHIINVVEVIGEPREVEDAQPIWGAGDYAGAGVVELAANSDTEIWANFNDPIFEVTTPVANGTSGQTSYFSANTLSDGTGTDATSSVTLKSIDKFAQATKMVFSNNSGSTVHLVALVLYGRPARRTGDIYLREELGASVTAYEERNFKIESQYIQDKSWAQSYATTLLNDFGQPENIQTIVIRAMPSLQVGDLISWQGLTWRIYNKKSKLDPSVGFIEELKMVRRDIRATFTIGVSTIGGADIIAA